MSDDAEDGDEPTFRSNGGAAATHLSTRRVAETGPDPSPREPARGAPTLVGLTRYRIDGEIGRGGMGAVFRAWDFDLKRAVALKVLLDDLGRSSEFSARFIAEAQVAARLQHPAVVPIYDVGQDGSGQLYFTMKLVEGRTLTAVAAESLYPGGQPTEYTRFRVIEIFREICRAMAFVHEHGVVHRDLKPDNVMVGRFGEVHLMDWGIAKAIAEADVHLRPTHGGTLPHRDPTQTAYGTVMGTPAFMSPEQARGEEAPGLHWDIYALGAILYYALTGRPPEQAATRKGGAQERPGTLVAPRAIDATIPPEVEAICLRALAAERGDWYPSAIALADDVQAFLEQRPVSAFPEGRLRRARKWARRHRRPLAGAGAALGLLGGAVYGARLVTARATREAARAESRRAEAVFAEARAKLPGERLDPGALRAERDRLLGLGLSALQAAQAEAVLAPGDREASRQAFEAALALGQVALDDQQWGLAASAIERAHEYGVDDARADRALAEVESARTRVATEHRKTVANLIASVRSGGLDRDAEYQDALFTLVGIGDAATVEALAAALDATTRDLRSAWRDFYLEAQVLTEAEAQRDEKPIPGLDAAVDAVLATPPSQHPPLPAAIGDAEQRLVARAAAGGIAPPFHVVAAAAQERGVGPRPLRMARLASEALGRIGIAQPAVGALERYLASEEDEVRAIPAAIALCLLGQPGSEPAVEVASGHLGGVNGLYWRQVSPYLRRFQLASGPEPTTARGYLDRGKERARRGDLEPALADLTRAVALDPTLEEAWLARGIAHRRAGDLDSAIDDYSHAVRLKPDSATSWNDRGFAELTKGDLDAALADFNRSIELRPHSARTLTHRGRVYQLQGRLAEAMADLDAAVKADPRFDEAYARRAEGHLAAHEVAAALADYGQAIAIADANPEWWAGRALARLAAHDAEAAAADASHAVDLDPQNGLAWLARARVRRERGDWAGALDDARRALEHELPPREVTAAHALLAELGGATR